MNVEGKKISSYFKDICHEHTETGNYLFLHAVFCGGDLLFNNCKPLPNLIVQHRLSGYAKATSDTCISSQARRQGGAMGVNAPPPHGPKRSAWKDPKMNLRKKRTLKMNLFF